MIAIPYDNHLHDQKNSFWLMIVLVWKSVIEWLDCFSDTCEGLVYLEENHIIHRDIAASNVLIADDNTAKISDFGLARSIEASGKENGVINEKIKCRTKWTAPEALESKVIFINLHFSQENFHSID